VKTGSDRRIVKPTRLTLAVQKKSKDNENNFPKLIATKRAREVSTTRYDTWWNAHSTPSQRRWFFTSQDPNRTLATTKRFAPDSPQRLSDIESRAHTAAV
jgi:hypothetical protein